MIGGLTAVAIGVSLVVGAGILVLALLDRRPLTTLAYGLVAVEAMAVVLVLVSVVQAVRGERPDEAATFVGYALTALLVPPLGAVWALSEKTKWGTAAAGASALVLAVVALRMQQVWG